MAKQRRDLIRVAAWTMAAVAGAVLCRVTVRVTSSHFLENLVNYIRVFLYLGLLAVWGTAVRRRVMQTQVRRYLIAVAALMALWLTMREFRWHLVVSPDVRRWLWYLYYVPILLIPLLALFVSMSLGKNEPYRLPRWTTALYIPPAVLIILAVTNDLHQWMFRFPDHAAMQTELDYRYGVVFYIVTAWVILCSLCAFIIMLSECRVPKTNKFLWLPLAPFGIAVVYAGLYILRAPFIVNELGDLAVFDCLFFTAFFESCIQCGLIQSNTRYYDLFCASVGTSAQIVDRDHIVRYAANDSSPFSPDTMAKAESEPVFLPDGRRLRSMPIPGGHVVWTEDISELLSLRKKLESVQEELSDRNELLQLEYAQEKEHRIIEEQNRLYDLMRQTTQSQLDQVKLLAGRYKKAKTEAERKRLLAHIVILGSYIKRRKDFVLSQQGASIVSDHMLSSALGESYRSLSLMGVRGAFVVRTGQPRGAGRLLAEAYDFFEFFMESVLETARYLNVHVTTMDGRVRCVIETDGAPDPGALADRYPDVRLIRDDDEVTVCILPLPGGEHR